MQSQNNTSNNFNIPLPKIDMHSKLDADTIEFTLSDVNVSIANALRRIILSDIPMVVFRVSPNDKNKCTITSNTCGLNNEIVKHRLSCIPIHINDIDNFPLDKYVMELNIQNNSDTSIVVTTKDFVVKEIASNKSLSEPEIQEIFPPNSMTGDYIDFVRLGPKPADEIQGKSIKLTCGFDIGTAKEDGAYNTVSTCSYGYTIDTNAQEAKLQIIKQQLKDAGKKEDVINYEIANWKLLDGKRITKKDSFDFKIQTIGVYTNIQLLTMACQIMIDKLNLLINTIEEDNLEISNANNTMLNSYQIKLSNEDYTLGKVIEYFLLTTMYDSGILTFCGFKMLHPHDPFGVIILAYKETVEIPSIKSDFIKISKYAIELFTKMKDNFSKLK